MNAELLLTGYKFSVYTRAARMALAAKGVHHRYEECDPFDREMSQHLRKLHPFGRVPVLQHGSFHLWETQAILDYAELAFEGPALMPEGARQRARVRQVMGIADAYIYWPLVRGIVSNALFAGPDDRDEKALQKGLGAAPAILKTLDEIAGEGLVLSAGHLTLADCLLWPMLDYFRQVPQGAAQMSEVLSLDQWAAAMAEHPVAQATAPDLSRYERSRA